MVRMVHWCARALVIALVLIAVNASASDTGRKGYMLHPGVAGIQSYEGAYTSCLRQTVASFCDYDDGFFDDMKFGAMRSELACCSPKNDYHGASGFLGLSTTSVGHCEWTYTYSRLNYVGVVYPETIPQMHGGFNVLCYLGGQAEECVTPFCDNMVLSAQGTIYHFENALTDDNTDNVFDACYDQFGRKRVNTTSPRQTGDQAAGLDRSKAERQADRRLRTQKSTPAERKDSSGGARTFYDVDVVDIMSGPLTVQSTTSGKRWNGWLQAVYHMEIDGPSDQTAPSQGQIVVRPNDLNIQIFDDQHY